jgi:sporulation protein YlmC with PRC-barrel domain
MLQQEIPMQSLIIIALTGFALSTGAAFAQAQQQQTPPRQPPAAQQPGAMQSGAAQAVRPVTYYNHSGEELRVSRIIGVNVRNNLNETVGEVEDLIMDRQGDVKAAIISVGGFLGIGERWVAVNYDSLNMMPEGNNWRVVLNTTRDQMKTAPEFKYEDSWTQRDRISTTATTPRGPVAPPPAGTPMGETPPSPR